MSASHAERVAAEIRAAMARQIPHRTQSDLGTFLGLSQAAVSRRLVGKVPFNVTELARIAEWLGVSQSDLLVSVAEPVRSAVAS